jgi:hypothetical protein
MLLQIVPHYNVGGTREGQQDVVVQLQHTRQLAQHMRGGDAMVYLDVEEVLGADGRAILLGDLVSEAAQGKASSVAGVFDDLS